MERVHVTEYCSFKPLEFASYYCSDHTVIKGCKHLISIDIHVSIVLPLPPPPPFGFWTPSSGKLRIASRAPSLLSTSADWRDIRAECCDVRLSTAGEGSQRTSRRLAIWTEQVSGWLRHERPCARIEGSARIALWLVSWYLCCGTAFLKGCGLGEPTSIPDRDNEFSSQQSKDRLWHTMTPIQWAPGVFLRV